MRGCDFWQGCPERVRRLGSFMPCCSKKKMVAMRYATSVAVKILAPLREFPSPTHWLCMSRVMLTVSGTCSRRVVICRFMRSIQCKK
jgi:hypothetical protein